MRKDRLGIVIVQLLVGCAALAGVTSALFGETLSAMPDNKGFATIKEILATSCSTCHDWTGSYDTITAGGRIVAGDPDKSILYRKIAADEMPAEGPKLTPDQKAFIRGWIAAGAPSTDLPIAVPAAPQPAASGSAAAAAAPAQQGFLFFPSKVAFHETTGFTSTALFLAAGVIGIVHFVDMMNAGHAWRDSSANFPAGFDENSAADLARRSAEIQTIWGGSEQTLRWWHVGLLSAGETLYLGDALTGISMFTDSTPGKLTKHDIHRYAFYTHATLMVAQIVLGFFSTDAMSRGDHDLMIGLGAAHAAIGLAIPAVMLGAGLENLLLPE
jgi:hypothetical protein